MKPTKIVIKHFSNEIVKRASKAFSKEEITKEEFDDVITSIDKINVIVSRIGKENEYNDEQRKDSKES